MCCYTPTPNPSPIKREGLQNREAAKILPFPHFGEGAGGWGLNYRNHRVSHSRLKERRRLILANLLDRPVIAYGAAADSQPFALRDFADEILAL